MSCPAGSYCKDWQCPAVCQGTNTPCTVPNMMYSCVNGSCVQDSTGLYKSCCDANCSNTTTQLCCNPNSTGECKQINGACPSGWKTITDCSQCNSKIYCCDRAAGSCSTTTYPDYCRGNTVQVNSCSETDCKPPAPPTPTQTVYCCNSSVTPVQCNKVNGTSCPAGSSPVSDCSLCTAPAPPVPVTVHCCNPNTGRCNVANNSCPVGTKQVSDCQTECTAPTPPTPSGSCPQTTCAAGGFPMVFWAEHPPIGVDPTNPALIQYFRNLRSLICGSNPAGLCVTKFLLRVEYPVNDKGVPNCFYPSKTNSLYTELLQYIPEGVTMYAMPYIDRADPWLKYPDTPDGQAFMTTQQIPCNMACGSPPCKSPCPAGYECHNGDCWMPQADESCGWCGPTQKCYQNPGAKSPKCITLCDAGMCCANSLYKGLGLCCDPNYPDVTCSNDFAKAVYLVKQWNDLMGRELFTGIVIDAQSVGWDSGVSMKFFRQAMRQLGVSYKVGTTYDGSKISSGVALLTATDDTRADEMYPEVYNLTTSCNNGDLPWPVGTELVDSYYEKTLGGCDAYPYPAANSMYAQAWKTATPAQTLWNGNGVQNFQTIIKNNWSWAQGLTPDVASRIFPLFSVEISGDNPYQTCAYPSGQGGPCGIPNAFGVWNTPQGAQEFIKFVKIFSQAVGTILPPGSTNIPITNYGIFSVPLLPLQWTGWQV